MSEERQRIIYSAEAGEASFTAGVKYEPVTAGGAQKLSFMPLWDPLFAGGWQLTADRRQVMDSSWEYTFEAQPLDNGFKMRLLVRNIQSVAVKVHYVAPFIIHVSDGTYLKLDNNINKISWLRTLGYQTVSAAGLVKTGERQARCRFSSMRDMADNPYPDHAPEAGFYVLDWQGSLEYGHRALIFSAITSEKAVTQGLLKSSGEQLITLRIASLFGGLILEPGQELASDWLAITFSSDIPKALSTLTAAWGKAMNARLAPEAAPAGWRPELRYRNRLNEEELNRNLQEISKIHADLPISLITLGDGYQAAVGDWLTPSSRYRDIPAAISAIKEAGLTPAIWLAPFVCQSDSKLMHKHQDWLLKEPSGAPKVAGNNNIWRGRFYALDASNPDFLAELTKWFTTLKEVGVSHFKLDFLYAAALPGRRYNKELTGIGALRSALLAIREAIGNEAYLACDEVPFGAAVGLADAIACSPKIERFWQSQLQELSTGSTSFPAAENAISATLNRLHLQRRLAHLSPCLALSAAAHGNKLTSKQLRTLYTTLAISGGELEFSENIEEISADIASLARLLPLHSFTPEVIGLGQDMVPEVFKVKNSDESVLAIAFFNWSEGPVTKSLNFTALDTTAPSGYHLYDPWENTYYGIWEKNDLKAYDISRHGCRLFIATRHEDMPQLVGVAPLIMSHLLPGIGAAYNAARQELSITLKGYIKRTLECFVAFPSWCRDKKALLSGGTLLDTQKRGSIMIYKINCAADEVVLSVTCSF